MDTPRPSVPQMWNDYLESKGGSELKTGPAYESWHFCTNKKDADELAELVVQGVKRATASLLEVYEYENEPLPKAGDLNIITDWEGEARCIIRTTRVALAPFDEVTEEFAATEGEGDKSLAYWRRVHTRFFSEEMKGIGRRFSERSMVVCEEFEKVFP